MDEKRTDEGTVHPLNPQPSILIESLRDIGYSFNSALADIIDNSITADAKHIRVYAVPEGEFKVAIVDDGVGLTKEELKQAMRLGSTDPRKNRVDNDLGRYGLGLKTASFSQCRKLTVVSSKNGMMSSFTWDLDYVVESNEWLVIEREDIEGIPYVEKLGGNGTLVLWESVDRISSSSTDKPVDYARIINESMNHLSLVFHRYLSGIKGTKRLSIAVNERDLEPIDPFNSKNHATQQLQDETICPGVRMQAYTLPHKSAYESEQEYNKYGLRDGYLKNQGVYLYRSNRLILYGTWFGIAKKTALTQLCRVSIDIDLNQDEEWKIDVKKVSAQLPEEVRGRLKTLISRIGAPSKRVYRKRGTKQTRPETYPAWDVLRERDTALYRISRDNPVIASFTESLNVDDRKDFENVLSLIESTFPKEAMFYDFANNEESVKLESISDDAFEQSCKVFFSRVKQQGASDEVVLSIMKNAELFLSRWSDTLRALGIEEQS